MIYKECPACKFPKEVQAEQKVAVDRRSKTYKEAIAKIMEGGLDKEAAVKIFDEEFDKL